jgi:hypothetical protein
LEESGIRLAECRPKETRGRHARFELQRFKSIHTALNGREFFVDSSNAAHADAARNQHSSGRRQFCG